MSKSPLDDIKKKLIVNNHFKHRKMECLVTESPRGVENFNNKPHSEAKFCYIQDRNVF